MINGSIFDAMAAEHCAASDAHEEMRLPKRPTTSAKEWALVTVPPVDANGELPASLVQPVYPHTASLSKVLGWTVASVEPPTASAPELRSVFGRRDGDDDDAAGFAEVEGGVGGVGGAPKRTSNALLDMVGEGRRTAWGGDPEPAAEQVPEQWQQLQEEGGAPPPRPPVAV